MLPVGYLNHRSNIYQNLPRKCTADDLLIKTLCVSEPRASNGSFYRSFDRKRRIVVTSSGAGPGPIGRVDPSPNPTSA